jgi:CRISPR/Cas system-associated exonuclease Cas4 (RecB family)
MARLRRDGPYFWVTWLTKLLAGENSCEWASWFRARHESGSWEQVPGDFDRAGWQMAHTAMVDEARERWEELGYQVFTERQNSLRLRGESGTLGGQPDLIARKGDAGTIIDVKTGKPGVAHIVQVMLYMYAVPRAIRQHQGVVFDGQVAYTDHAVDIPAAAVDDKFVERLSQLIGQLASDAPARRVPSPGECRFCPITAADCPDRAAEDGFEEGVTTDF